MDHFRVTVPVSMDQRARRRMAAQTHSLYRPLPKRGKGEGRFGVAEIEGRESPPSLMSSQKWRRLEWDRSSL